MTRKDLANLLRSSYRSWSDHNAPRLGAALAFYMLLSMAPLLVLLVTIVGLVLTKAEAQQDVLQQARALTGAAGERTIAMLIHNATEPKTGIFATCIALITLFSGASGVFTELRDSLNTIWDAPKRAVRGIQGMLWQRLVSFGMVLSLGLLLLVSLLLSAALTVAENFFFGLIPVNLATVTQILNFLLPLVMITLMFGLIYKFVPDVPIAWRDVWVGAMATSLLFSIGKSLLGWYLGTLGVGSTYGAAGSLVAFVVWVYYSAQIFFFGAAFTRGYSVSFGSRSKKKKQARIDRQAKPDMMARSHGA